MRTSSVFNLADVRPFDALSVPIEPAGAPMNEHRPPVRVSRWQPLLDRMKPGESVVLELSQAQLFLRWLRAQSVRCAQSKVSPLRMRVKVLEKPCQIK